MKLKFQITDNHYFSLHSQFLLDLTLFTLCKWDIAKKKYSELKPYHGCLTKDRRLQVTKAFITGLFSLLQT